ncbi:cation:proton antiporter [Rhodococcoides corynebacterioides]|uniref:cation:proton antiporter n=1 Tax=Rhodococcoides corynebacterioides TaxID=53972 RepID=UPI0008305BDB|nr:monovalent cation/H(+) antiporter subunit G [Rhodococcus corynebacterioides]MBY6352224.1 monovalent cation/H(+) antiporter subunit G [Rhodococcus corynebacterioides]
MSALLDVVAAALVTVGVAFFTVGTIGLIRLPDRRSRLHALTKADNLGLGLVVLGLAVISGSIASALLMVAVWILALGASATTAALLASDRAEDR